MGSSLSVRTLELHQLLDRKVKEIYPSTEVEITLCDERVAASVKGNLHGIGMILTPLVDLFIQNTHILYLDACHCNEGWVIMIACFLDGNHSIQPIGFYIAKKEDYVHWVIFMNRLRRAGINHQAVPDLVINSDQGPALLSAMGAVFTECEHMPCAVHRERHFQKEWNKAHGDMGIDNIQAIEVFNAMVGYYRKACRATTWNEFLKWMEFAQKLENDYSSMHGCRKVKDCY